MIIPKLKKIKSEKKHHDILLEDEYAWVDQPNILEVLKDANKLDSNVKDYINANNKITSTEFDIWMSLLKKIKNSVLWLYKSNNYSVINLKKESEIINNAVEESLKNKYVTPDLGSDKNSFSTNQVGDYIVNFIEKN